MKPPKEHKLGTFEVWISFQYGKSSIFVVKEDGTTEFGYSTGDWDDTDWDRRDFVIWPKTKWEFMGYL